MTWRRILPGIVFGFLVFLALALFSDLRQVGQEVRAFAWQVFPAALALTLFNYLLRGLKFYFYLDQIGARKLSLYESYRLFVAGFPLAMTPGKVGEVLKAVWIEQKTGAPAARGVAVVVAERVSDGLAVLLLSTAGVVTFPQYWPGFVLTLALLVGGILATQIRPAANAMLNFWERLPLIGRFSGRLREFYEGSFTLFRPSATLIGVGLGMVSWLGEGIAFYIILLGLGAAAGWETLALAVFTLSFSTVVGAASTLPGGLGAAEASIAGMLVFLGGLPAGMAAAATLLIRFATLWFGVLLGLVTAFIFRKRLFPSRLEQSWRSAQSERQA